MTITLPPRVEQALEAKASEFGQSGPEYLKSVLFAACHGPFALELKLPPLPAEVEAAQPQLSLQ